MIAASEPLEFVPHGRTVLAKHPTQIYSKGHNSSVSENSLLYKLTNFAIKDESLLAAREGEEKEWWFVREMYYRGSDDFKDDTPKDSKSDYTESFRPQSRNFNISIKSELMGGVKKMDTDCANSAGPSSGSSANSSSNMSKKFNLNSAQNKHRTSRPLNPKTDSLYEEELYVKGCTAVWSKGLVSTPATKLSEAEYRETICCYTIENPIKHAAFANFHVTINNTMLIDALNSQIGDVKKNIKIEDNTEHLETKIMPSILLIDSKCMKVFAMDGREYINSIPFQVKKVWPMKYGVLLEKDATPLLHSSFLPASFIKLNESHNNSTFSKSRNYPFNMSAKLRAESVSGYDQDVPLPTCFSLAHPLDEVTPILLKSPSHGLQYYNDGDVQIIFVSTDPSIILLYDWKLGCHSLWKIRKALRDECLAMCPNMNSTTTVFSQSCDFIGSPMQSNLGKNTTNWATGVSSPLQSKKITTPTLNRSRVNSPMAEYFHQQGLSPHTSTGQGTPASIILNTIAQAPPSLPLYPDICLDHIWTDSQSIRRDPIESPSDMKTFLHTDLVGHDYMCFMVKTSGVSKLHIIRLKKSHSHGCSKMNLIVGSVFVVLAKDAVVLDHLKMIALIDEAGNIILHSGNSVVGKVHVGGVLARLIESSYCRTLQSPFPRRSSLLPHRPHDAAFDDSALHLLSPVPHSTRPEQKETLGLRSLCDAAGSRVTLVFEGGAMYRIALPAAATSTLVAGCMAALKAILPKDIAMQVTIKWYGVRNAPGTQDLTSEQEWTMFASLLYSLAGYDVERLAQPKQVDDQCLFDLAEVATKKQRTSSDGTQDDWEYLLNSKLHMAIGDSLATMLNLNPVTSAEGPPRSRKNQNVDSHTQFNTNAMLFPYIIQVLYALHLLYEDLKLNTLLSSDLKPLSVLLHQISKDLKLNAYVNHYWLDFPTDLDLEYKENDSQISPAVLEKLSEPSYFCADPPNIFAYLNAILKDIDVGSYPYLSDVNEMSKDVIEILCIVCVGVRAGVVPLPPWEAVAASSTPRPRTHSPAPPAHIATIAACQRGITPHTLDTLPPAVALILLGIFNRCKSDPPPDWPPEAYRLAMREELAALKEIGCKSTSEYMEALALEVLEKETAFSQNGPANDLCSGQSKKEDNESINGMEHLNTKLLSLLYPKDRRMTEVINLLQSSTPVTINLTQRPEVSDHDFIEEQEKHLQALSTRTMALPVARGMLTLRSLPCVPTEPLTLPKLCVTGRGPPPRCNTISLSGDTSPNQLVWPTFHNGVAAGLALVPMTGSSIHSSWVLYNKPRGTAEMSTEHAGFLMALGLNGHLRDMPFMNIYEYLAKSNEMTSVGLLLGLGATYRGTMHLQATKMMSIHLEALLPPTSIELDIQQNILVAALMGIGLLYQGTQHSHLARVVLDEIGKPPGPEMENCVEREGYALAAGLALGMIMVRSHARTDAHMASRLRTYMLGGDKHSLSGIQRDKYKQGSFAVREGATVNLDVTSPGATVALGLVFLQSNNAALASWLEPPTTHYLLDTVRPDLLMLRVIARGLVLWDGIEASEEWIENQVPDTIKPYCFVKPVEDNIDYEAMNQAYCNIVAGACFALGLRFAGSGDEDARDATLHYVRLLLTLSGKSIAELAGRSTLEACLCVCLLAAGMIMCGRGDVSVLRVCRRLRARVAPAHHALTHGGQMAVHCTIGLLFLGGGRATLSTTPEAIAALLAAFFPKFPTHSEDNRYHLQAFRHLYVLAVEPRLILPRDLDTGKLCYANIQVIDLRGSVREMLAPCIVPELSSVREVRVHDPRYWTLSFTQTNWEHLKKFLEYTWCIEVKPRSGAAPGPAPRAPPAPPAPAWGAAPPALSIGLSPDTSASDRLQGLTPSCDNVHKATGICADCLLVSKKRRSCSCRQYGAGERQHLAARARAAADCLQRDCMCALPVWTAFLQLIKNMDTEPTPYHMWQVKLLLSQIEFNNRSSLNEMRIDGIEPPEPLISNEYAIAIKQSVSHIFDSSELELTPYLRKYLGLSSVRKVNSCPEKLKRILSSYIVYYDLIQSVVYLFDERELSIMLGLTGDLTPEATSKFGLLS